MKVATTPAHQMASARHPNPPRAGRSSVPVAAARPSRVHTDAGARRCQSHVAIGHDEQVHTADRETVGRSVVGTNRMPAGEVIHGCKVADDYGEE